MLNFYYLFHVTIKSKFVIFSLLFLTLLLEKRYQ